MDESGGQVCQIFFGFEKLSFGTINSYLPPLRLAVALEAASIALVHPGLPNANEPKSSEEGSLYLRIAGMTCIEVMAGIKNFAAGARRDPDYSRNLCNQFCKLEMSVVKVAERDFHLMLEQQLQLKPHFAKGSR